MLLHVAARGSPLALRQCEEVLKELRLHHPQVRFDLTTVATLGDKDKKTSLRSLSKTDFFTREVDERVLTGQSRIAIHSAKDLPDPLPDGLAVVALTQGVDPADALVMRPGGNSDFIERRSHHCHFIRTPGSRRPRLALRSALCRPSRHYWRET